MIYLLWIRSAHNPENIDGSKLIIQIISSPDTEGFARLLAAHRAVHTYLATSAKEDSMFTSADDLSSILWTQELQAAIDRSTSVIAKLTAEKTEEALQLKEELQAVNLAFRNAADTPSVDNDDVFGAR